MKTLMDVGGSMVGLWPWLLTVLFIGLVVLGVGGRPTGPRRRWVNLGMVVAGILMFGAAVVLSLLVSTTGAA